MFNKKLSVIVPFYNSEKYVDRCVSSLINQDYENIEILLINDGSSDNTLKLLKEFEEKDKRIKVFTQENSGVSSARNLGLKNASGEYVTFVDSDDELAPMLNHFMKIIQEKELDVLGFAYKTFKGKEEKIFIRKPIDKIIEDKQKLISGLFVGQHLYDYPSITIAPWAKIIRKDIIPAYDENAINGEDIIHTFDLITNTKKYMNVDTIGLLNYDLEGSYGSLPDPIKASSINFHAYKHVIDNGANFLNNIAKEKILHYLFLFGSQNKALRKEIKTYISKLNLENPPRRTKILKAIYNIHPFLYSQAFKVGMKIKKK